MPDWPAVEGQAVEGHDLGSTWQPGLLVAGVEDQVGVAVAVVFLNRPRVRAELQGAKGSSRAPAAAETPIAERIEAPGPAH